MKYYCFLILAGCWALMLSQSTATACNVCHSKNPKMVRMHAALEYKDCFDCHGPAATKSAGGLKKQMVLDDRCTRCHGKKQGLGRWQAGPFQKGQR